MRKKLFLLETILLLTFVGCSKGGQEGKTSAIQNNTQVDIEVTTEVTNNKIIKLYNEQLSLETISKGKIVETTQNKNICIEYPAIDGNSEKFDSVNALIKKCAEDANSFYYDESLADINITCTYEITYYTGKHITILFDTLFSARDIAHPTSYSYGVTIDIENARVLDFEDMGLTLADVEARIEDNDYSIEYGGMKIMSDVEASDTVKKSIRFSC